MLYIGIAIGGFFGVIFGLVIMGILAAGKTAEIMEENIQMKQILDQK